MAGQKGKPKPPRIPIEVKRAAVARVFAGETCDAVAASLETHATTVGVWTRDPRFGGDPNFNARQRVIHPPAQLSLPTERRPSNAREHVNAPRASTPNFCPGCGYDLRRFRR